MNEQKTEVSTSHSSAPPDSEEVKNAVDIVLDETNKKNIYDISEEEKADFVNRTNEVLNQLTEKANKPFESVDEIEDAYSNAVEDEYVDDTLSSVDSDKIDSAINNALDSVGAKSIEQIPEEKKEEFVQRFESGIALYAPDVDSISDKLNVDESLKAIKKLQAENDKAATSGKKVPEAQTKTAIIIIVVAVALVVTANITLVVVYKKARKLRRQNK